MNRKPCLNCKLRHLNCHSDCEKYQDFYKENEKIKKKKKEYSENAYILDLQYMKDFKRIKRW